MAIGSQLRERESEGVSVVSVCVCVWAVNSTGY